MTADYNPTEAQRLTPAVARGLLLINGHFDNDGHNWTEGTEMEDFEAAYAWIKSGGPGAIADQLEAAGREVDRLTNVVRSAGRSAIRAERDSLRAEVASVRAVADPDNETPELSLRDRVMHVGEQAALLVSVTRMAENRGAERDSLRQQLEAARMTDAAMTECARTFQAERDREIDAYAAVRRDLAAAQKRIAELEAEAVEADEHWAKGLDELEAIIGAIYPVYRAADEYVNDMRRSARESATGALGQIIDRADTARSALTPDILAALELL